MPDKSVLDLLDRTTSRRRFIREGGLAAVIAGVATACKPEESKAPAATQVATPRAGQTGGTMGAHDTASGASAMAAADAMDAMHEKGIKAFPAKTAGIGNQLMQPRMENGVRVYELTAKKIQWETEPGHMVEAWAYNDQVPGPQIRVKEGDHIKVILHNQLPDSTSIHFHGLELPNAMDGVPFITQPPVKPGESFTYDFVVPNGGSNMYHSHHNSAKQVGLGLLGAFIVDPKGKTKYDSPDVDHVMVINDGSHGYTFNGKSFPATEPIVAKLGQKVRIRFMNEGMMIHPMHLHGVHMTVIAKDGWPLPAPWRCDTLNVAPGERWDVIVNCTNPGTWAFHCHILPHAESANGMFGMVTALVIQA
jgi:FtsP/CotA-like multicopper oxidase with cupredoxin domain